jgi:hypothetical protein
MSKSDQQRFSEATDALLSLASTEGMEIYNGYAGVQEWLSQQADPAAAEKRVGALLSLGYQFGGTAATASLRDAVRALLLVQITRCGLGSAGIKALKARASSSNPVSARATTVKELKELCSRIIVSPGGIFIDTNIYKWANKTGLADIGRTLRAGRDRGVKMLQSAYQYVAVGGDPKRYYAQWFGTADAREVAENLQRMMDAYRTKSIDIYADESQQTKSSAASAEEKLNNVYGSAIRQQHSVFLKQKTVRVNLGEHFFGKTATHSHQIVYDDQQVVYLERALALSAQRKQAEARFFAGVKAGGDADALDAIHTRESAALTAQIKEQAALLPTGEEQISVAGVILHEVSHNTVGTTDVVEAGQTMYGPNLCAWLARSNPDMTADNADNYRLFCEQFLT